MATRPQTTVTLPNARAAQLERLSVSSGVSVAELIEQLINREIAAGRLVDSLPGFEITTTKRPRRVILTVPDGIQLDPIAPVQARTLADAFEALAGGHPGKRISTANAILLLTRRGRGIVLQSERGFDTFGKASMTPTMARDLARQLRAAAAEAESQ